MCIPVELSSLDVADMSLQPGNSGNKVVACCNPRKKSVRHSNENVKAFTCILFLKASAWKVKIPEIP